MLPLKFSVEIQANPFKISFEYFLKPTKWTVFIEETMSILFINVCLSECNVLLFFGCSFGLSKQMQKQFESDCHQMLGFYIII
jgi:hypothetical protein